MKYSKKCIWLYRHAFIASDMINKFKYPLLLSRKIGTSVVPLTLGGQLRPLSRFKGCGRYRGLIFFVIYT